MYEIIFSDKAKKQLEKLPGNIQERIGGFLERIKIRPHSFVKKLVGTKYFRGRVGDYRVILDIQSGVLLIMVLEIGHRKNIYKK
jgi:mRNA interferase RelE/StbE